MRPTEGKGLADTHLHTIRQDVASLSHSTQLCPGLKGSTHSRKHGLFDSVFHCVLRRWHSQPESSALVRSVSGARSEARSG